MSRFKENLTSGNEFVITCELIPGRGFSGKGVDAVLKFAEESKDSSLIHALSLTDNAGGNPALSPDVLGREITSMGVELIMHFSCKDMNRNFMESRAYALRRRGITNLLVMSGDYPASGYLGVSKPAFDIDSVMAVYYLGKMNEGLEVQVGTKTSKLDGTGFFVGAVMSPFKWSEGSSVMQYYKLEKKICAGAKYIVTQLGYDSRKYLEAIRYVRDHLGLDIPMLGSVYVLTSGAARFMNRGEVPGCFVSDRLLDVLSEEAKSEDKGKGARLERAARQVAMLKGLGYRGAHIEGLNLKFDDVRGIVERANEIGENWREYFGDFDFAPEKAFYLFEGGEKLEIPAEGVSPELRSTTKRPIFSWVFWGMDLLHKLYFTEGTLGYRFMRAISRFCEGRKKFLGFLYFFERGSKKLLFDCRECGDCALPELYFFCPESNCPKSMRNGPCGGSRPGGKCEVFEDRDCVWEKVYWRTKYKGELGNLKRVIAPRNWDLYETSSWLNFYTKRDHVGVKLDMPDEATETSPAEE